MVQAAEPEPASQSRSRAPATSSSAAAEHVRHARQLFAEQKYAAAAEGLQRAYTLEPNPLYLFNAGTAYRKAEQRKDALELYQRYLEVAPSGSLAAEARTNAAELEALIGSQEKQETLQQALDKERRKPIYKRPWFIALASAAGAAIGIGLIVGAVQQAKANEVNTFVRVQF